MKFTYSIPTKILFGPGSFNDLATTPLPGKKALVVITAGKSMRANGYLDRLIDMLDKQGIGHALFDKILPNPVLRHVHEGAALAREQGCDFVIGLGGGSSIDSAKSIAVMAKNPGDYWDYISGGSGKGQPLVNGALPIVAIATTAGTVVDPEMMLTIPAHLTAYQGFDALFHATEGYIANVATPLSDAYALKSIELLAKYLPAAVKDGSDLEARTQVALASTLSGMVESTSCCTSEHGMEHALSAFYPKLPHGAGLIMLSEAYYSFFADKAPERFTAMAKAMGVVTGHLPEAERPMAFVKALVELQKACGVDGLKMSDYGITKEDMAKCAANARHTMGGLFELDPYALSLDETTQIMMNAYK